MPGFQFAHPLHVETLFVSVAPIETDARKLTMQLGQKFAFHHQIPIYLYHPTRTNDNPIQMREADFLS